MTQGGVIAWWKICKAAISVFAGYVYQPSLPFNGKFKDSSRRAGRIASLVLYHVLSQTVVKEIQLLRGSQTWVRRNC